MAYRPGTQILIKDGSPPRAAATETSTFFAVGQTQKGSHTEAVECTSMTQYAEKCGIRTGFTSMYDAADMFFREGGTKLIVGRVVGTTPVKATANILDQSGSSAPGDVAATITAKNVGDWANSLNFEIQQVGSGIAEPFEIIITHDTDGELERSGELETLAELVAWATNTSEYVDIALGASSENPRDQGPTGLAGGTADSGTIGDAHYLTALALFDVDLGPGQVAIPGGTTGQRHEDLATHAEANNRVALLDLADTDTVATLTGAVDTLQAAVDDNEERYCIALAPWVEIPGIASGTVRTCAPSGMVAGIIARNDQAGTSQNKPSANLLGISRYANDVSREYDADERDELNTGGVSVIRNRFDQVKVFGYRTLADPVNDKNFRSFANMRFLMALYAKLNEVAERYVLREIDGRGVVVNQFGGELRAELLPYYNAGSLYGDSPEEAFTVDVGPNVNTDETLADGELRAVVGVRMSPFAELVTIELVKVPSEESIL